MSARPQFQDLAPAVAAEILRAFDFESIRVETGVRPIGLRFSRHIFNIHATLDGQKILATGEGLSQELAFAKTISELVERAALIRHGHKFGATTSNGWAAHPDLALAKANAIFELVERDAVLAHWYSGAAFVELRSEDFPSDIQKWVSDELSRSEFPRMRLLLSHLGFGPSVTCLLINANGFGVSAHATRNNLQAAICAAVAEACRPAMSSIRRECWKSTMKLKLGEGDPQAPEPHSLYYSYHEPFPQWMFGKKVCLGEASWLWDEQMSLLENRITEFRFTTVVDAPITVGFAEHPKAFSLRWGNTDANWVSKQTASERLGLKENQINKNVHIIA